VVGVCRNVNEIRGSGSALPPVVSFRQATNQEVAGSSPARRTISPAMPITVERDPVPGTRGHVTLVADDDRFYWVLLAYEIRCGALGVRFIRVFRPRLDAERWLEVMSAARNLLKKNSDQLARCLRV
jgi:hypothetical protein